MKKTKLCHFDQLPIRDEVKSCLPSLGFRALTPVQAAVLPVSLAGKNIVAKAQTGSGKTLSFAITLLNTMRNETHMISALVLCPTRELAEQVAEQIRNLAKGLANTKVLLLCGGTPMPPQIASLGHGANVIVGTPGRIVDHLNKQRLDFSSVRHFVLDEADRMLEMGFEEDLKRIQNALPRHKQVLLFSATFPENVEAITSALAEQAERFEIEPQNHQSQIEQCIFKVNDKQRLDAVAAILSEQQPQSAMVFCVTKKETQQVAEQLAEKGFPVALLHGDLEQKQRNEMLAQFSLGSARILVATDVAARGLDIDDVPLVINYRLSDELDTHTHRIGRTGRAGKAGLAYSLMSPEDEIIVARLEEKLDSSLRKVGAQSLRFHANRILAAEYACVCINGGKKDKLRPGDLLGALTKDANIDAADIGKIKITATVSFIAVKVRSVKRTMNLFREGRIKGRRFRARKLATV